MNKVYDLHLEISCLVSQGGGFFRIHYIFLIRFQLVVIEGRELKYELNELCAKYYRTLMSYIKEQRHRKEMPVSIFLIKLCMAFPTNNF